MIRFLVSKTFFDGFDHLLAMILMSLGALVLAVLAVLAARPGHPLLLLAAPVLLLGFWAWSGAQACLLQRLAGFQTVRAGDVAGALRRGWLPGLQAGLTLTGVLLLGLLSSGFYLRLHSLSGVLLAALSFALLFIAILSLQYLLPILILMPGGYTQALKKCFLICFDNAPFSLFLLAWSLALGLLSCCFAFLLPGTAGVHLARINGLRLRLYKYDWLEAHPGTAREPIPWAALLEEDRARVGPRSLRSLIFPWKD